MYYRAERKAMQADKKMVCRMVRKGTRRNLTYDRTVKDFNEFTLK